MEDDNFKINKYNKHDAEKDNFSDDSFSQRLLTFVSDGAVFGGIIIYAAILADLIGMTVFLRHSALKITQNTMYILHLDSVNFRSMTFLETSIILSYFVSFLLGGLIIFAMLKIASMLAKACDFYYSHSITRIMIYSFITVFVFAVLISILCGDSMLSEAVCRWFSPLCAFAGGLAMYSISLRNVDVI